MITRSLLKRLFKAASLLATIGCAGAVSAASALIDDRPEFRIGVVISATGGAASSATGMLNTLALLEEELAIDQALAFKVRFIRYDDGSEPTKAVEATRKLIRDDRVHLVICCTTARLSLAIQKTIDHEKVPNISLAAPPGPEAGSDRNFAFHTEVTDRLTMNHILDYMLGKDLGTVAVVVRSDAGGDDGSAQFSRLALEKGIDIVTEERFTRNDTGFLIQAMRIAQKNPDAIYFHAAPPEAMHAHEAIRRAGYIGAIFHGGDVPRAAYVTAGGDFLEGSIFSATPLSVHKQLPRAHPLQPDLKRFVLAYEAKSIRGKADLSAAQTHDAVVMAMEAWRRLPAIIQTGRVAYARAKLRDSIEATRNYPGVAGMYTYSPTDHVGRDSRSALLAIVKEGRLVPLKE